MGPFALLDFVGLDTTYYIANIMFDEFREQRFAPPPLLKRMVLAGHLGKKSRQGLLRLSRSNGRATETQSHGELFSKRQSCLATLVFEKFSPCLRVSVART